MPHQTDIQITRFDTPRYQVQILDVPGHSQFMKNMVTGTSQGDMALLLVSAVPEELHAGFSSKGQAKEHLLLMYTLGMHQLIVAINKMDSVDWSQLAFKEAVQETTNVLKKIGYNTRKIPFVPISGTQGENLLHPAQHMDWYKGWKKAGKSGEKTGITLVSAIDSIDLPKRLSELPLRISIQDVYQVRTDLIPVGRVESGVLEAGMELQISPSLAKGRVKTVEPGKHESSFVKAYPGDKTGFILEDVTIKEIKRGSVCSDTTRDPVFPAVSFTASLVAMPNCSKLMKGDKIIVDVHNARVECTIVELLERIDRRNGQVLEEFPKALKEGDAVVAKLVPSIPFCIEPFSEYPALGRVALRDQRRTLAVGIVKTVEKRDNKGKTFICPVKK
ncbi:translation elongation factor EF-1 alpha [Coelomomyces lativittatus]|nr:translation elongation factor EF-1 alpha [Coelomomyces lativittatus]